MSSLSDAERVHRWARQLRQLQRNPRWVWGSLVGGVLVATLIRWALGGLVHDRIPFTTYYPAIVAATLFGGFWRGVLASILSAVVAWWLFMPPAGFALDQAQLVSLITFFLVCLLLVGTVTALAVDRLLVEIDFRRGGANRSWTTRVGGRDFGGCHHHQGSGWHHHQLEQGC